MAKIACVFAHPDDEAFGPGGTIALLARTHDLHIICVTDGDVASTGLKSVRSKELLASAQLLGAKQVHFLNFVDGSLSNSNYHQVADALKLQLDLLKPSTILTFDSNGVSGHLDHIAVTSILNWLFPKLSYLTKIMYFCQRTEMRQAIRDYFVYMPPGKSRGEVDEIVDTSSVYSTQVAAMRTHVSQKHDCDWLLGLLDQLPKEEYFLVRSK